MRRFAAFLAMIGFLSLQGISLWHDSHDVHTYCSEHGAYEHLDGHDHHSTQGSSTQSHWNIPGNPHDHCQWYVSIRGNHFAFQDPQWVLKDLSYFPSAWSPVENDLRGFLVSYRLAPKQSPPSVFNILIESFSI